MGSGLGARVARVVLPLIGCGHGNCVNRFAAFFSETFSRGRPLGYTLRTLHQAVRRGVDTVEDDGPCCARKSVDRSSGGTEHTARHGPARDPASGREG